MSKHGQNTNLSFCTESGIDQIACKIESLPEKEELMAKHNQEQKNVQLLKSSGLTVYFNRKGSVTFDSSALFGTGVTIGNMKEVLRDALAILELLPDDKRYLSEFITKGGKVR